MINNITIKSARYQNSSRTLIFAEVVGEDGNVSTMTFQAPPNNQLGVNPIFDKVVEQITLEKMSADFKQVELQAHRKRQYASQKQQSDIERAKMTALLEKKAQAFENPIVEMINSRSLRTAIRKAKNEQLINSYITAALVTYIVDNKLNLEDTISLISGEKLTTPTETHTFFDKDTVQETVDTPTQETTDTTTDE